VPDPFDELAERLGHTYGDPRLLTAALTHRSYANERPGADNERMEFLGDAILELAASRLLFERFPEAEEGELTRRRADLVCERSLAALARDLELGELLRLGKGEERSGGRKKPRLLASALEAVVASVMLDASMEAAMVVARRLLEAQLARLPRAGARDFKSRLQERVQGEGRGTPRYEVLKVLGPDHERIYRVAVRVDDVEVLGEGEGRSKSKAEQAAAEAALSRMEA
jgi:ribonuclease-3